VRRNFPEARLICQDIPFRDATRCLSEHRVDVLWNPAPVRHPAVTSVPLALTSRRIGVVSAHHPLADIRMVDAAHFSRPPILYNPCIPQELMNQLWLADLRPLREAQLIETNAINIAQALRRTVRGDAVVIFLAEIGAVLGPHLRALPLTGAAPVHFYAAHRHADRRGAVHALLEALQTLSHHLMHSN
jgi:hypothetical protein